MAQPRELGFWKVDSTDDCPSHADPRGHVDADWRVQAAGDFALVLGYLESHGCVESYEQAYSWCRFDGCPAARKELGCVTFTDGAWVWPEGYAHYVKAHSVRPPQEFVDHVKRAAADASAYDGRAWTCRHGLMWDPATHCAQPLPSGTRAYLEKVSTLKLGEETNQNIVYMCALVQSVSSCHLVSALKAQYCS